MYLKNKIFIIVCLLSVSCTNIIEDPAKKYNDEFLRNNYLKIRKKKAKHLEIARENNIYYRDEKVDLVDSKYFTPIKGTKLKKDYRDRVENTENNKKDEIKYLGSDLSIYYKERRLKDKDIIDDCDYDYGCVENIIYIEDNYPDYSKEKVMFSDIKPSEEKLYGSLELRKDKSYNYIDSAVMQENFDYIDIMNRVKKELYLKEKRQIVEKTDNNKNSIIDNIKNKFKSLFGK